MNWWKKTLAACAAVTVIGSGVAAPTASAQTDPFYVWRNDPVSKFLAAKPLAPAILHRVPGSWFDATRTPAYVTQAANRGRAVYGPGTPIFVGEGMCTVTAAGTDSAGRKVAITAGHCGGVGSPVVSADSRRLGRTGTVAHRNEYLDYAVIHLGENADITANYNGAPIRGAAAPPPVGHQICKNGYASGFTCGHVWQNLPAETVSQVCAMQGDSGAPVYVGDRVVGMINNSLLPPEINVACTTPLQGGFHAPTVSVHFGRVIEDLNKQPRHVAGHGFRFAR